MSDEARLAALLDRIDGRSYPAYRDLRGIWELSGFSLVIDRIQGDPFAAPSRVRVQIQSGVSAEICEDSDARVAAEDWLLRRFGAALVSQTIGSGRSGDLRVLRPGPEVEERSAIKLSPDGRVEARFQIGLPARGRRVLGRAAWTLIDGAVRDAAVALTGIDGLDAHVRSIVRQRKLRRALPDAGLVGFIEDGAVLPRASGIDSRPLTGAVPFVAPDALRVELMVEGEVVRGLGIKQGVTVIVGGGFHGKSTLLTAIQRGHLDHIPGDGREGVVADPDTVKVRAEDGRRVEKVDISVFLDRLPGGRETRPFSTDDASGSTSQAAAIMEAVEAGARVLLLDEDTSATNLLVRDAIMRRLIAPKNEPITPFVDRVRSLAIDHRVSTVIVVGGVGDYLRVADTVLGMVEYRPEDMTAAAKALVGPCPESEGGVVAPIDRRPVRASLEPGRIKARDGRRVSYGRTDIDLVGVEQILSADHAWSVGQALAVLHGAIDGGTTSDGLDALEAIMDAGGVDTLSPRQEPVGGLIRPRRHEVAAAMNRHRGLSVSCSDKN
jgi:predicted ABC-class ATPase